MVLLDFHLKVTSLGIWGSLFEIQIDLVILSLLDRVKSETLKAWETVFPLNEMSQPCIFVCQATEWLLAHGGRAGILFYADSKHLLIDCGTICEFKGSRSYVSDLHSFRIQPPCPYSFSHTTPSMLIYKGRVAILISCDLFLWVYPIFTLKRRT